MHVKYTRIHCGAEKWIEQWHYPDLKDCPICGCWQWTSKPDPLSTYFMPISAYVKKSVQLSLFGGTKES